MSTIYFDEEDRLESVGQLFVQPKTEVHLNELDPKEAEQISYTTKAAERAFKTIKRPALDDLLPPGKVARVAPDVAESVNNAASKAGLVPTPEEITVPNDDLQDYINELEVQKKLLENPEIPLPEIAELAGMPDDEKRGFLMQYANLVGELMELLSKLGDRDRKKNDHMKKEYDALNKDVGQAIADRGKTNFWSNLLSFGFRATGMALGAYLNSENITRATDMFGQQIPNFAGLAITNYEVKQSMSTNKLSMITTEMQNISQKSGDNSGWKNELIQNLNDIKQWMSAAVRQG